MIRRRIRLAMCAALAACAPYSGALASPSQRFDPVQRFNPAQDVGLDQKLGAEVPLDLSFRDETGRSVKLGDCFGGKPVILSLVYFECPMLCTEVLNEEVHVLRALSLEPGKDFELVTVSIDPRETPELAAKKKQKYLAEIDKPALAGAWHFLVGDEAQIQALAHAVGFRYVFDEVQQQYAHAGGIIVLTPKGIASRYFYGIEYLPRDVRLALVEAGEGKVGSMVDQFLMLCFHYDPVTGKYGLAILTIVRFFGIATVVALVLYIARNWRRDAKRAATLRAAAAAGQR
jgi:protein SCO1/2